MPGQPAAWESKTLLPQGGHHQPKEKLPKKREEKIKWPAAIRWAVSVTRTKYISTQFLIKRGNVTSPLGSNHRKGVEGRNYSMLDQQFVVLC